MRVFVYFSFLFLIGFIGAIITKKVNEQGLSNFWFLLPSLCIGILWAYFSKLPGKLSFLSTAFDIAYAAAYVIAFAVMGERLNTIQIIGFIISMFGVYLMN